MDVAGSRWIWGNGGTAGTRTQDQSLKRALLYQLSYRPDEPRIIAELVRRGIENANGTSRSRVTGRVRRTSRVARRIGYAGGGEPGRPQAA